MGSSKMLSQVDKLILQKFYNCCDKSAVNIGQNKCSSGGLDAKAT